MDCFMLPSTSVIVQPTVDVEHPLIGCSVARELFMSQPGPILEPYKGMEFESEEAAREFYNAYAVQLGFKSRVSSFIRSKRDKTIISRQLVCSREGFRSTKADCYEGKRHRMITRVGCRAMIMVKKRTSGKWIVSKFEKIHNHLLGMLGKAVMLDYDPYAHTEDELIDNPMGLGPNFSGILENTYEMAIVPPESDPVLEPQVGMEFESEQSARAFYKDYARCVGFRARVSSYYRSKRDKSIISRLIVCSKEGFSAKKDGLSELQHCRVVTRIGCKAMVMFKKLDTGKWIITKLVKNHNHILTPTMSSDNEHCEPEDDNVSEIEKALIGKEVITVPEPYKGMEFDSEESARVFYFAYSGHVGFNMRVSTYYRSKCDKSIISRLFVCSKEGFYVKKNAGSDNMIKRPREASRVGCKAMLMVKKNISGNWAVSKFEKEHNHPLGSLRKQRRLQKRSFVSGGAKMPENQSELEDSWHESPDVQYNLCREAMKYA